MSFNKKEKTEHKMADTVTDKIWKSIKDIKRSGG